MPKSSGIVGFVFFQSRQGKEIDFEFKLYCKTQPIPLEISQVNKAQQKTKSKKR